MDIYHHITKAGEGQYREKMSRFLAFAVAVSSAEEAKAKIKEFQNAYHDARHVCWAYMLGSDCAEYQSNDNGEPSGTAGRPILGQIRSHGVTDVLVVVVRYFGGIKLGTSGLITAYKEAASLALDDAGRQQVYKMEEWLVEVPYVTMDGVMRIVKEKGVEIIESEYGTVCTLRLAIKSGEAGEIIGRLSAVEGISLREITEK